MKRILLLCALALLPWQLQAAKKKAAPATASQAEPDSPDVRPDGSPEVTDPDLKEAVPAMRQGTDEPVGGFKDKGRQGDSVASFGWSQGPSVPVAMLGWRYWLGEHLAVEMGLGGGYSSQGSSQHDASLVEELGLRFAFDGPVDSVLPFLDLRASAQQGQSWSASHADFSNYTQHSTQIAWQEQYAVSLRAGAELFWPGSKRVSLEASGGLRARWTNTESSAIQASAPIGPGLNSTVINNSSAFDLGSDVGDLLLALNLYY